MINTTAYSVVLNGAPGGSNCSLQSTIGRVLSTQPSRSHTVHSLDGCMLQWGFSLQVALESTAVEAQLLALVLGRPTVSGLNHQCTTVAPMSIDPIDTTKGHTNMKLVI